jgi:hypothetical protein
MKISPNDFLSLFYIYKMAAGGICAQRYPAQNDEIFSSLQLSALIFFLFWKKKKKKRIPIVIGARKRECAGLTIVPPQMDDDSTAGCWAGWAGCHTFVSQRGGHRSCIMSIGLSLSLSLSLALFNLITWSSFLNANE